MCNAWRNDVSQKTRKQVFGDGTAKENMQRLEGLYQKSKRRSDKLASQLEHAVKSKDRKKIGALLLNPPNGQYGIKNKFIIKIQISHSQFRDKNKLLQKLRQNDDFFQIGKEWMKN